MTPLRGKGNPHPCFSQSLLFALTVKSHSQGHLSHSESKSSHEQKDKQLFQQKSKEQKNHFSFLSQYHKANSPYRWTKTHHREAGTRKYRKRNCIYLLLFRATRSLPNSHWSQVHRAQDTRALSLLQLHRYWHPRNESAPKAVQPGLQYWVQPGKSRRAESEAWDCWKSAVEALAL